MAVKGKTVLFLSVTMILFSAASTGVKAGCCCPSLWTAYGRHCYRFFSLNLTWQDAEQYCQSFSLPSLGYGDAVPDTLAHLVSIHSQAENNFVHTLYDSSRNKDETNPFLWIGLHDRTTEDSFEWTDGTPVNYNTWRPDQPNNWGSAQDCGTMQPYPTNNWNDLRCSYEQVNNFICKLPIL